MEIVMCCDNGFQDGVASAASEECTRFADEFDAVSDNPVREGTDREYHFWDEHEAEVPTGSEDENLVLDFQPWLEVPLVWGGAGAYWCIGGTPERWNALSTSTTI